MADANPPAAESSGGGQPSEKVKRWQTELESSRKVKGFKEWQTRGLKIVRRYRDERTDQESVADPSADVTQGARFNILWSNVQTLMPALYAKTPKPVVERRYLDRDDVGRTASVILERSLNYELEEGHYTAAMRKAVLDRLLPGRGVVWLRYEPKFEPMAGKTQTEKGDDEDGDELSDDVSENDGSETKAAPSQGLDGPAEGTQRPNQPQEATTAEPEEQVADESVIVDYIDWQDFQTSPSRTWEEVWWVAKRVYMTREELVSRFGEIGNKPTLDWSPIEPSKNNMGDADAPNDQRRAKVWEIWNKTDRKVYWFAESYKDALLDEKDDPLRLEGFWPVPKPLYSTQTNSTLVPVPDYYEYQDQANELDDLTARIQALVKTIKVAGIYDASIPEIGRIFQEGKENELVPTSQMTEFSQKAGPDGMGVIWLIDLSKQIVALKELYLSRESTKQSLYEITGISDIIRGQASGNAATATEQRMKGQFASMRLNDMQSEVQRFARDTLRIMGEIIAEHFDPMTLFLMSGYEQYAKDQWPADEPQQPPQGPQPQPPMMGHNGGPPLSPASSPPGVMPSPPGPPQGAGPASGSPPLPPPAGGQPIMLPPDPAMLAQIKARDMFVQAIKLIRDDKLRGFRIDIETDSIVEADQQQTQQARTELLGAIAQFLPQAIQAGAAMPELKPLLARLLMFFLRGFKASRDIEAAFEQFIDDMTKDAANPQPKPPSPEELKMQSEQQKQQAETQREMLRMQNDQQQAQQNAQLAQQQQQLDAQRAQQEFEIESARAQRDNELAQSDHQRKLELLAAQTEHEKIKLQLQAVATEHKHEVAMEALDRKAESAPSGSGQ